MASARQSSNGRHRKTALWGISVPVALVIGILTGGALIQNAKPAQRQDSRGTTTTEAKLLGSSSQGSRDSSGARSAGAVPVKVVHPREGGLPRTTTQPGVLHYYEYADLKAKASGYLRAQVVDIGDSVRRGQVLAEIYNPERLKDVEEAAAEVEAGKAQVIKSEAELEEARTKVVASKAEVRQRQAEIERATAERKYREKEYLRYQELARTKVIDARIEDEQQKNYESARADEDVAKAAVETARGYLAKANAEVTTAEASLRVAKANLQVAETRQTRTTLLAEYLKIVSPYDGIVTRRTYHRGAFIPEADKATSPTILAVARADLMRLVIYVPDRNIPLVDVGDPVVLELDALPGEQFKATVSRYSHEEISENRTMRVEADFPNPSNRLKQGMYGLATILLEKPTNLLTIPSPALISTDEHGGAMVWLVKNGHAHKHAIRKGQDDGLRVEVLEGLSKDDTVIASSVTIEDGEPVKPEPASEVGSGDTAPGDESTRSVLD